MRWHLAIICCIVICLILSLTYSHFPTDVSFPLTHLIAPDVTTISIILSSNKIQNRYIQVPANPGPHGKWPLKQRECYSPFGALTLLVGWQDGHPVCKNGECWFWCINGDNLAWIIALVVTTTSIILSWSKIQKGDVLVLAYPGCPGKSPLNEHSFIL